ncbi:Uncharacterised protein [Klebsiella aerogenes]|nr:Uncharacterised protein [Klebsiella aerogenes]
MLSKPTIDRSSGTFRPRRFASDKAPSAITSLWQKTAVGGTGCASSCSSALAPASESKVAASDIVRIDGDTAATQRLHVTLQTIMAQRHIFPGQRYSQYAGVPVRGDSFTALKAAVRLSMWTVGSSSSGREFVRHDHRRQIALLFHAGVEWQARAEQHHAVDSAW